MSEPQDRSRDSAQLTDREYWEAVYEGSPHAPEIDFHDFRNFPEALLLEKIESLSLDSKSILEIGAGDSRWLTYFALKYPASRWHGLDYTESGCDDLRQRARRCGADVTVYLADMFHPPAELQGQFDVVMSFGVVEHFADLADALMATSRFARTGGKIFTSIPNLRGLNGLLFRKMNRAVYDAHHPHDLRSFVQGHRDAGLIVREAGYLVSSHFGVLSSCVEQRRGGLYHAYVALSRLSKLVWLFESKAMRLPATKWFSPYLYCISQAPP